MNPVRRKRIINLHWGFSLGGIAKYAEYIDRVREYVPVEIHNICIARTDRYTDEETLRRLNAKIIRVDGIYDPSWVRGLRSIIQDIDPHYLMVHAFNGYAVGYVARKLTRGRLPLLASYHGRYYPPAFMKRLVAPVYNGFGDFVLRNHAQAIVTVAHHCAHELTSKGIDGRKITVVHNGIPDKMAMEDDRTRIRREWGIDDQTIIVMAASQLVPYKGIDYLIDGFVRQLVNRPLKACLMILGRGPYENDLKQRVVRLGRENEIRFGGMRSDIVECFAAADVFVLPSLVEAHSIALLEAMRAGIPIIATDVGGNTESVRHEREALIVPPADSTALSESLERLLVNETLRNQLGKAARTRFLQEFTDSCMIEATAKWFANVIC